MNQEEPIKGNETATAHDAANQTSDIFKLDIDCFEEAFDYLSLESLVNISQTCKRLQNVANYIYQQQYSGTVVKMDSDQAKHFTQFVRNIEITSESDFQQFLPIHSKFKRLTEIDFYSWGIKVTKVQIQSMMEALKNIETFHLNCVIDTDCFESLINASPNVKRIDVDTYQFQENLPLRTWTTLEYFGYYSDAFGHGVSNYPRLKMNDFGLVKFLEINQNIRHLATDYGYVCNNGELLKNANVKLENLAIRVILFQLECIKDLNELYERGFYKRLHLYMDSRVRQTEVDLMVQLKGLVKVYFGEWFDNKFDNMNLTALNEIEELRLFSCWCLPSKTRIPIDFTHLKRVHMTMATFDDILLFVSRAERLIQIKITDLRDENDLWEDEASASDKIINLAVLNKARTKLANGRNLKVTIYVPEKSYLATKWAMKQTDFNMINLRRIESSGIDEYFNNRLLL